jgi:hypothetical protein
MDHDSIRHMLSEYLDGAVTPAERSQIEKHLSECRECRKYLRELEQTVQHLRNLGELEPPPWLTARIMARVREEAGREKGLLRRLLQAPLRWRIPLEAAALVFLCVTGYLIYRNVSSELPQIVPLSGVTREEPAPATAPAPATRNLPDTERPAEAVSPPSLKAEKPEAGSVPLTLPEEEPYAESRQEELEPAAPSPVEVPRRAEDKAMSAFRMQERNAAKSLATSNEFSLPEHEDGTAAGVVRSKTLPSSGVETLRFDLHVDDIAVARHEIERVTVRFGGVVLRRDGSGEGEDGLVVRLQREAVRGYIEQLKKLGDVRGPVSAAPEGEEAVEIYLTVTRDQE